MKAFGSLAGHFFCDFWQLDDDFFHFRACANCQQKHVKCSGEATCERCKIRNLECTFVDSGKKRGPKTNDKYSVQVFVSNGSENCFDETTLLSSMIPNPAQSHESNLSLSGYPQQQTDNFDDVTLYSEFYDPGQNYIFNNFENRI
ncbi:40087_t:CDS:2 [Gigaspora margarita]|uniref:40087_t:CDS:1 n=1 Tax=Gigaspora margarita TaxID=4874 RepID=A0ABN7V883_GIGMA|nr:40087_t:CDS:2 [Gigaspora margarita]